MRGLRHALRRLGRDERGNVSVMFCLGALLLVALIMTIAATGQKLIQREVLQDSSDAAALAGAIIRAKALNLIAFCNLVMAIVLGVLLVLKGVVLGLTLFLPVASSLCSSHHYDYCAYIPYAQQVLQRYQNAADDTEQQLKDLAQGERDLAAIAPALALAEAYRAGTDQAFQRNYGSGLQVVAVPPSPESLPLADDSTGDFFDHQEQKHGTIAGAGLIYLAGVLGSSRPGRHAFGMSAAGVVATDNAGEVPGDSLPLALASGWKDRRYFRVVSSLGDTDAAWRRRIVGVAAHKKSGDTTNKTLGSAQGELFAFRGHEDLWHMDWRGRLSLSQPFIPVPEAMREFWVH